MPEPATVHPTARVEAGVTLGAGTRVWDHAHVRHGTTIGDECVIGEKVAIAYNVKIGHRCKVNALAFICTAVTLEDGVMVSAGTVFTNDKLPRAATPDLKRLNPAEPDEHTLPTLVREGATIGANCTVGCGLTVGRFAMIGMGSVVTRSIADFALAVGHPAAPVGVVCRCGQVLLRHPAGERPAARHLACGTCGRGYELDAGVVTESNGVAA